MKLTEIVGGLYVYLPLAEEQFLIALQKYMKNNNLDKIKMSRFKPNSRVLVESLIRFNVLDYDGEYISMRIKNATK